MQGKWRVSKLPTAGKPRYRLFRALDTERLLFRDNVEWYPFYSTYDKKKIFQIAKELNEIGELKIQLED